MERGDLNPDVSVKNTKKSQLVKLQAYEAIDGGILYCEKFYVHKIFLTNFKW